MLNTALSNAGTIAPLLNSPSEPPLRFDGQLEYLRASVSKLTPRFSGQQLVGQLFIVYQNVQGARRFAMVMPLSMRKLR